VLFTRYTAAAGLPSPAMAGVGRSRYSHDGRHEVKKKGHGWRWLGVTSLAHGSRNLASAILSVCPWLGCELGTT
jgi:hypothetical protein